MAKRKDGPHWVKAWISDLSALTDKFRDLETGAVDFTELGKEEYKFRMALSRKDFTLSERARKVWDEAVGPYQQRVSAARKNPQDAPNGNAGVDMSDAGNGAASKLPTSCDKFTADGDTREAWDESATVSKNVSTPAMSTRRRAGGSVRETVDPFPPARQSSAKSGDVLSMAYSGEFSNVILTQAQYNELGIKFGNQQKLNRAIDSLSCKIENGETNPRNHYAELVKWAAYRDDMEEAEEVKAAKLPHYETVSEHNARIVQESDAWIHEYCQQQKKNRKSANG